MELKKTEYLIIHSRLTLLIIPTKEFFFFFFFKFVKNHKYLCYEVFRGLISSICNKINEFWTVQS